MPWHSSDFILAGILLLVSQEKLGQAVCRCAPAFWTMRELSGSCFNPALPLRGPVRCVRYLMGLSPFGHILITNMAALGW